MRRDVTHMVNHMKVYIGKVRYIANCDINRKEKSTNIHGI